MSSSCPHCGAPLHRPGSRFCPTCGKALPPALPQRPLYRLGRPRPLAPVRQPPPPTQRIGSSQSPQLIVHGNGQCVQGRCRINTGDLVQIGPFRLTYVILFVLFV